MNSFQLQIFKEINKSCIKKNFMISPISIYHILSLTTNGANNKTQKEMVNTLGHNDKDEMNKQNKLVADIISKFTSVELANAVFSKFVPESEFTAKIKEYKAGMEPLKDENQINSWVSDATKKKITKIIDRLTTNDRMVLVNAIYFQGKWSKAFKKENNIKDNFMNFNKEPKMAEFMKLKENFQFFENEEIQAISLKYQTDSLSALIILPKNELDINSYLKGFTDEKYDFILKNLFEQKIFLSMPKFEINYGSELKPFLQALGINDAFNDNADFSGMTKKEKLYISKVIHKAFIKVDEQGTEAAAATAVVMTKRCIVHVPEMNINHPFLFIVRGENLPTSHDILFISKVECL